MSQIDRRSFVITGGAAVAGLLSPRLRAAGREFEPVISVGFWPSVARGRAAGTRRPGGIFDASTVLRSEPSFMRTGARMSIGELHRTGTTPLSVALDIRHHVDLVEEKVAFQAWSYKARPGRVTSSSTLSFTVPVDVIDTVDVALNVATAVGSVHRVFPFTTGAAEGALRLNPGHYIFSIGDRAPQWSSHTFENDEVRSGIDDSAPAFDYLVISVSHPAA